MFYIPYKLKERCSAKHMDGRRINLKWKRVGVYLSILIFGIVVGITIISINILKSNRHRTMLYEDLMNYAKNGLKTSNEETEVVPDSISNMILDYVKVDIIEADENRCIMEITAPNCGQICREIVDSAKEWDRKDFAPSKEYFILGNKLDRRRTKQA
jgi:hypothetical protein